MNLIEELKSHIESTPIEILKKEWKDISQMKLGGPTVKEYVEFLRAENREVVSDDSLSESSVSHDVRKWNATTANDAGSETSVESALGKRIDSGSFSPHECDFMMDKCKTCGISGESHDIIGCGLE